MADARIRRPIVLLALIAGGLIVAAAAAWAYWTAPATPGSSGGSVAATVNGGVTPAAAKNSSTTVTVSWDASTLSNGAPVDGYQVRRYDAGTLTAQTLTTGCSGTRSTLSCTEMSVPQGSWRYSVVPVIGSNWAGAESGLSNTVVLSGPVISLSQSFFRGPFPVVVTGNLSGFGANEPISYRLDSATPLTGYPTVVGATGTAPINSLTLPSMSEGTHTITVTGANGSVTSTMILVDTTAPVVSASLSPSPNGAGWITAAPVQVTLTATDTGGSGVAAIRYTTDGSDPTTSATAVTYSTPFSLTSTTTVRYYATDAAGNASAVASRSVPVDATPPGSTINLSSAVNAVKTGSTVYYRGAAAGSFTLTNAVTDAISGPASSSTAALAGTATGWAHTPSTVSTPAGGPYVSNAFTWSTGTTSAPTETVTAADVAGNTTATTLSFVDDSVAPAGGSISYTSGFLSSPSVSVSWSAGTDSGSGMATASGQLQRASAPMTAGVCGTYGSFATIASPSTSPYADSAISTSTCYQYRYLVNDAVGNQAIYSSALVAKAPRYYTCAAAAVADGAIEYYKLTEAGGTTTAADSSGNNRTGTYVGTRSAGLVGACLGGVTLDGATGYVTTPLQQNNPMPYAEEAWFRTTSTRGGLITGYAASQTGTSAFSDRTLFMTSDGRVSFQTSTNVLIGLGYGTYITTTAKYNDGQWHHVVATQSSAGMALYLDGVLFQSNTEGGSYVAGGYWRIGYMSDLSTKTNGPASSFFGGSLSNVAFYNTLLSAGQVMDHYIAGAVNSAGQVTAPASISASVQSLGRPRVVPPSSTPPGNAGGTTGSNTSGGTGSSSASPAPVKTSPAPPSAKPTTAPASPAPPGTPAPPRAAPGTPAPAQAPPATPAAQATAPSPAPADPGTPSAAEPSSAAQTPATAAPSVPGEAERAP
ncbi:LamG-like jellyroll fold domain-containing protein [Actinoplanes sp. N902-109]|uniref:LamG-like jellyroll fold domain-containing protein n=1 Tax=Actinoplanes sp. (strain N902-109) TaxID=649831 RepID=UPI00032959AB|nr:LamG-like jellyroll fold domain-containing protein [Actinoplanes sp. N902-109]AGL17250.1 PKD domain containing protein [Actinoplanes sp. N902-109]